MKFKQTGSIPKPHQSPQLSFDILILEYQNQILKLIFLCQIRHRLSPNYITKWKYIKVSRDLESWIFYEKIIAGPWGPGGPTSAIFATIDLDPLYFEVHIFLDPVNSPNMSQNLKMCYFEHFFGVRCHPTPHIRLFGNKRKF